MSNILHASSRCSTAGWQTAERDRRRKAVERQVAGDRLDAHGKCLAVLGFATLDSRYIMVKPVARGGMGVPAAAITGASLPYGFHEDG